jgi:hypothetical protein
MAIDTTRPRTRRAILLGAAGAVAATTAAAVARPIPALAAGDDGQIIHVGVDYNDVRGTTILENWTNDNIVLDVENHQGGTAIWASSGSGHGVTSSSDTNTGVHAASTSGTGVAAFSTSGVAVDATSGSSIGVRGQSEGNSGVSGYSGAPDLPAVGGWSGGSNTGVYGFTGGGFPGPSPKKTGVYGLASVAGGTGVVGRAPAGRGGLFAGRKAQLRLVPSSAATHPTSGATGDLFVDKSGRLWFCRKGGNPAVWKQVSLV